MRRRKLVTGFVLAAGSLAGTIFYRRRVARRRERVDVYFEDGSMVTLTEGSPETASVLPLAHRLLATARG
ncbi:MAG TPA: hypothetical protein VFA66_08535 [Gaiellaceae bacterium]|nr:hypothetical protein [Gaiellaceae bacterium]